MCARARSSTVAAALKAFARSLARARARARAMNRWRACRFLTLPALASSARVAAILDRDRARVERAFEPQISNKRERWPIDATAAATAAMAAAANFALNGDR